MEAAGWCDRKYRRVRAAGEGRLHRWKQTLTYSVKIYIYNLTYRLIFRLKHKSFIPLHNALVSRL